MERLGFADRVVLALVGLLLLGAALTAPLARAVSPGFAVWSALPLTARDLHDLGQFANNRPEKTLDGAKDPWDQPLRFDSVTGPRIFSVGPDSKKEIPVRFEPSYDFLAWSAYWLGGAAIVLLWAWALVRLASFPRAERLRVELVRAALLSTLPAAISGVLLRNLSASGLAAFAPIRAIPGLPPWAPPLLVVGFVIFLAALGLRMRRGLRREREPRSLPWRIAIPIILVVAAAVAIAVPLAAARTKRESRARLLALAEIGVEPSVDEILERSADPELVRAFLAVAPEDFLTRS